MSFDKYTCAILLGLFIRVKFLGNSICQCLALVGTPKIQFYKCLYQLITLPVIHWNSTFPPFLLTLIYVFLFIKCNHTVDVSSHFLLLRDNWPMARKVHKVYSVIYFDKGLYLCDYQSPGSLSNKPTLQTSSDTE